MKFEQVCKPLNAYFSQHPIFRVLLPLAIPLMLLCEGLQVLGIFISLGGFVYAATFLGFFLFLILVVSTCDFRMASIGLAMVTAEHLISLLRSMILFRSLSYGSLVYVLVFGWLTLQAYRKSAMLN